MRWEGRGYLEQLACALAVGSSNDRRVDVLEAALLEEFVRRERQVVADAHHARD